MTSTRTTTLTTASLIAAARVIPAGTPFFMLNMLRYKAQADYGDRADHGLGPCTGREAYHRGYVAGFVRLAEGMDVQPAWFGSILTGLVTPPDERWDEFVIVRYPSYAAFRSIVESSRYETEVAPHRIASLDDWRLIATTKLATP